MWTKRREDLEDGEIKKAIQAGLLESVRWDTRERSETELHDDSDYFAGSIRAMLEKAQDPHVIPMVDPGTRMLIGLEDHRTANRTIEVPDGVMIDHGLVALNTLGNLPGIHDLSIAEIIDVRESLSDYLPAFRSEMIKMADSISEGADLSAVDIAYEVNKKWDRDIAPAVTEMKRAVASASEEADRRSSFGALRNGYSSHFYRAGSRKLCGRLLNSRTGCRNSFIPILEGSK